MGESALARLREESLEPRAPGSSSVKDFRESQVDCAEGTEVYRSDVPSCLSDVSTA